LTRQETAVPLATGQRPSMPLHSLRQKDMAQRIVRSDSCDSRSHGFHRTGAACKPAVPRATGGRHADRVAVRSRWSCPAWPSRGPRREGEAGAGNLPPTSITGYYLPFRSPPTSGHLAATSACSTNRACSAVVASPAGCIRSSSVRGAKSPSPRLLFASPPRERCRFDTRRRFFLKF